MMAYLYSLNIKKLFSLLMSVCMVIPYYILMDYPFDLNPDIENYAYNYINEKWSYDIGYEFVSYIIRNHVGLGFIGFWSVILALQSVILSIIYRANFVFIIALGNIIVMSEFFYGTQVRYSLACLFFVVLMGSISELKVRYKIIFVCLSISLHFGLIFIWLANSIKKYLCDFIFLKNPFQFAFIMLVCILVSSVFFSVIEVFLPFTRFYYYSGSEHFVSKSLSSTLYIVSFSLLTYVAVYLDKKLIADKYITLFMSVLLMSLITSDVAVLSGRLLLFSFIIEPFVIFIVLKNKKTVLVGFIMLVASLSKCFNYLPISSIF